MEYPKKGRPKAEQKADGKRFNVKFRAPVFDKWNTLKDELSKTHDNLALFLIEFYEERKDTEPVSFTIPPLTPIKPITADVFTPASISSSTPRYRPSVVSTPKTLTPLPTC